MIFDSLVADFVGEIRRWTKSANIELCVISSASGLPVDDPASAGSAKGISGRVSLIQNFAGFTTGRRLKIGRTLRRGF